MKKHLSLISLSISFLLIFNSCSIEKRVHKPGYFIKFHHSHVNTTTQEVENKVNKEEISLAEEEAVQTQEEILLTTTNVETENEINGQNSDEVKEANTSFIDKPSQIVKSAKTIAKQISEEKDYSVNNLKNKTKSELSKQKGGDKKKLLYLIPLGIMILGCVILLFGVAVTLIINVFEGEAVTDIPIGPFFIIVGFLLLIGALITFLNLKNKVVKPKK